MHKKGQPGCPCCEAEGPTPCPTFSVNTTTLHCNSVDTIPGALIEVFVDGVLYASDTIPSFLVFGFTYTNLPIAPGGSTIDVVCSADRWATQTVSFFQSCPGSPTSRGVLFNMLPASGYHCVPCCYPQPTSLTFTDPDGSVSLTWNATVGLWVSACTARTWRVGTILQGNPVTCVSLTPPQAVNVFFASNGCGVGVRYPLCSAVPFNQPSTRVCPAGLWTTWPAGFGLIQLGGPDTSLEYPCVPLSFAWSISGTVSLYGTGTHNFTLSE